MENEMTDNIKNYLTETMVIIPEGNEQIRKFRDNEKWLSSNYRMSMPGIGNRLQESVEEVKIASFQMSKYPVTNQLYQKVNNSQETYSEKKLYPKVDITWYESINFCNRISKYFDLEEYYLFDKNDTCISVNPDSKGFRLPTEAEWQYACKAGAKSFQYSQIDQIAWHKGNSDKRVHNTGGKQPNQWSLFDMLGNVWEWTWDLFNQETYPSYRVFRGGSFAEPARICGATTRRKSHPDFSIDDLGFRLARSI